MPNKPLTSSNLEERLAEIQEEAEKKKVKLTPEVQQYIREHLDAVQEKLVKGEPVFEEDMEFMDLTRKWILMPEFWRKEHSSIDEVLRKETEKTTWKAVQEAGERNIMPKQWLDLLHVAEAKGEKKEWIDEEFDFPGGGKIKVGVGLDLIDCTSLTSLPEGLEVGGHLNLYGCISLTSLPEGLSSVGGYLDLRGCTSLTSLPEGLSSVGGYLNLDCCRSLTSLPEGLSSVGGYLSLKGCTFLTSLPEGLSVGEFLDLSDCTSLTSLPKRLSAKGDLVLENCTSLASLPKGLSVGKGLYLKGCRSLTSLPDGLSVERDLNLEGCTSLASLPKGLSVRGKVCLSEDLNRQIKKDVKRLRKEGKIKEKIDYI